MTRDYRLDLDTVDGHGGLLTVVGGKVTTYRKLAEQAVDRMQPLLGDGWPAWTADAVLLGGDIPESDFLAFLSQMRRRYNWLPETTVTRLARAYGSRIELVLGDATGQTGLGEAFGADLCEAELDYLKQQEWAA